MLPVNNVSNKHSKQVILENQSIYENKETELCELKCDKKDHFVSANALDPRMISLKKWHLGRALSDEKPPTQRSVGTEFQAEGTYKENAQRNERNSG